MNSNVCQANVRRSVQANTLTTRSRNGYKRSGVHTPSNVREFKRFTTAVQTSSEECDDVDNMLDNTCEVIRQETVLFSTPETDYIIYD